MIDIDHRRVLLVNGSPRKNGNTDRLLHEIERALSERGVATSFAALRDYSIHSCTGCERCRVDETCTEFYDGMHLLYPLIEQAAGLVVGSPTYNYNITPEMKCFIDRFYPYFHFGKERPGPYSSRLAGAGRKLVTVGVCEQKEESEMRFTMPAMSDAFSAIGYEVVEELAVLGHFAKGSVARDEGAHARAARAGAALADALQLDAAGPPE